MLTYKQRFNEELGFEKEEDHSLKELIDITNIPVKILKEVEKSGYGAYDTNLSSVRLKEDYSKNPDLRKGTSKRLSSEQWAKARVYAFLYKSIVHGMKYKKKKGTDLYDKVKHLFL